MGGSGSGVPATPIGSASFELFLPEVMPHVAGCPEMIVINAIRNACREFCKLTTIWRYTLPSITSETGEPTYTLPLPEGADVVHPVHVTYDGSPIYPATEEDMNRYIPTWKDAENGTPTNYLVETKGTIRLYVPPDEATADILVVRVALCPTVSATTVDDIVYSDWVEEIAAGALARLMKMPGKDWSNPDLGLYNENLFQIGMAKARGTVDKGHVKISGQAQMQYF